MNKIFILLFFFLSSCVLLKHKNNRKYIHFVKTDYNIDQSFDSSKFVLKKFDKSMIKENSILENGKHVFATICTEDLIHFNDNKDTVFFYFWYQFCPSMKMKVRTLDSLVRTGSKIILLSSETNFARIDAMLKHTNFYNKPYLVLFSNRYGRYIDLKEINFLKELLPQHYQIYKDDIWNLKYIYLYKGKFGLKFYRKEWDL